jgi:hypothetical protein
MSQIHNLIRDQVGERGAKITMSQSHNLIRDQVGERGAKRHKVLKSQPDTRSNKREGS